MMPEWHQLDSSSTMPQQQESTKKKTLKSSSRSFSFSTGLIDLAKSNNIQNFQVYTVYANTNMAGTQIVCPIYTINLGGAQSDLVVSTSDFGTSGTGSIPGWAPIIHYFFFFFQLYNAESLPTSNMN